MRRNQGKVQKKRLFAARIVVNQFNSFIGKESGRVSIVVRMAVIAVAIVLEQQVAVFKPIEEQVPFAMGVIINRTAKETIEVVKAVGVRMVNVFSAKRGSPKFRLCRSQLLTRSCNGRST